ncbi:MAG TPA: hypothetical protein VIV11_05775 [Kofleriaceae bacterium]
MLRLYVIFVALAAACSDSEVEKLEKIRDEVCACKTAKCAESALDRVPKQNVESTPRAQRVAREMLDCLATVYENERPTQDPDAPSDPETSEPASARRP